MIDTDALIRTRPWQPDDIPAWEANENGAFNPFFDYHDRATYLAWVEAWKQQYAALAAEIRRHKAARPALQRAGLYDSPAARPLHQARRSCYLLLLLRRAAKRDSWAKRQAAVAA